jgi:hypothetical protein
MKAVGARRADAEVEIEFGGGEEVHKREISAED